MRLIVDLSRKDDSLDWVSIAGIVIAISGAGLYFLRRLYFLRGFVIILPGIFRIILLSYDIFIATTGILCGSILLFKGYSHGYVPWLNGTVPVDITLLFGQILIGCTNIFFGYQSIIWIIIYFKGTLNFINTLPPHTQQLYSATITLKD